MAPHQNQQLIPSHKQYYYYQFPEPVNIFSGA